MLLSMFHEIFLLIDSSLILMTILINYLTQSFSFFFSLLTFLACDEIYIHLEQPIPLRPGQIIANPFVTEVYLIFYSYHDNVYNNKVIGK